MTFKKSSIKKSSYTLVGLIAAIMMISLTVTNFNTNQQHQALAQQINTTNTTQQSTKNIDTFQAKGQISSLVSDLLVARNTSSTNPEDKTIWVLGGDWSLNVVKGSLTNFNTTINMIKIDGSGAHHHTIGLLTNPSGMPATEKMPSIFSFMFPHTPQKIELSGNTTMFTGNADIKTNGNIKWKDVLIHVAILNGHIFNMNIDPSKTDNHFKAFPILGIVQSITDENGRDLITR